MEDKRIIYTIMYGLASAVFLMPTTYVFARYLGLQAGLMLSVWLITWGYARLLLFLDNNKTSSIFVPAIITVTPVFLGAAHITGWSAGYTAGSSFLWFLFWGMLLCSFSLVRGRSVYGKKGAGLIFTESLICGGGAALVSFFEPSGIKAWAAAVWLFFLVQAVYFPLFGGLIKIKGHEDKFEAARQKAESLI